MVILIAESKTMETKEAEISSESYEANRPAFEEGATEIMDRLREMSIADLVASIKISSSMASRLRQMIYDFPYKGLGLRAIEAFTGVVFKNLDYSSLSQEEKDSVASKVRIISSLYGWLKPEDIIKPYRLEYTSPVAPGDKALSAYWRGRVTVQLVKTLQQTGETEILDLLPADAAKCVDLKLVKRFAKVWKVDFKEQNGEAVRSPHAGRLKALRGLLLRSVITNDISQVRQLASFENDVMMPIPDYEYRDRLAFYV